MQPYTSCVWLLLQAENPSANRDAGRLRARLSVPPPPSCLVRGTFHLVGRLRRLTIGYNIGYRRCSRRESAGDDTYRPVLYGQLRGNHPLLASLIVLNYYLVTILLLSSTSLSKSSPPGRRRFDRNSPFRSK